MNQKQLRLNFKQATVAIDGQTIAINDAGPVNLSFFQVRGETQNTVDADVVASVRLRDVNELEQLKTSIEDTIRQHRNKED